ncbi:hypothetical protein [Actibacterium atlanticum]|uniref:hypothetical protein n=1 Tax=Actibacterium atlanticum TaxID=1461693 RepID=UPI0012DCCAC0|nr:hypothetical protein [Actibacterium atlanticum]
MTIKFDPDRPKTHPKSVLIAVDFTMNANFFKFIIFLKQVFMQFLLRKFTLSKIAKAAPNCCPNPTADCTHGTAMLRQKQRQSGKSSSRSAMMRLTLRGT